MSRAARRYSLHRDDLLRDIASVLETRPHKSRFRAAELLTDLRGMPGPWAEWLPGRPLTAKALSMMLLPVGVKTEKVRVGDHCLMFYRRAALAAVATPSTVGRAR